MHLLLVGISHHTAPVELRERLDFQTRGLEPALRALVSRGAIREAVVVSTCNRAEIYAAGDDPAAARQEVVSFIGEFHGIDRSLLQSHVYSKTDAEAARHLFRVAAGLDSLVVGEPQIMGQVKDAHAAATASRAAGPLLNRLFHSSFAAGKRVRTETGVGSGAVSVSFAAVAVAKKIFQNLAGKSVVVVGAGEMGKLTALHMKTQGVQQVTIVSRTLAHAARTAQVIGGASAAPWDELNNLLGHADIVITATGAVAPILTKAQIEAVMRPRRNRPLFLIDIAMPRDVEAAAGEIEQVFLYNIDDLQATVRENLARRAGELERAERIVSEDVEKFVAWLKSRTAVPIIVALRQHFDAVRKAEVARRTAALPAEMRDAIDDTTRLIVEKMLLTPTEQLKALGDADAIAAHADVLTRVFGLSGATAGSEDQGNRADPASAGSSENDQPGPSSNRRVEPFVRRQKA